MLTEQEVIDNAIQHYSSKLQEEMSRFGVKYCYNEWLEALGTTNLERCSFWPKLSEDFDLHFAVFEHDSIIDGYQNIMIVSQYEIPRAGEFWELWNLVSWLKRKTLAEEKICRLHYYDGNEI